MTRSSLLAAIVCAIAPVAASGQTTAPYRDPHLAAEQRAADLVARMTLAEKAAQIKDVAPGIPRLGVPGYNWWSEGLHGVARAGTATVFPQAIGLAATWDAPLLQQSADIIATEFRAKYRASLHPDGSSDRYRGLTVWSPNINIFRDPRWGRGQETYGEDPYLTARLGVAFIQGLQGNDPAHPKTIATAKHFAVHSGPEADRHREDVHPSAHDLEDTYLPAFHAAVTEGHVQAVMCAYNAIDGIPACASPLLQSRIRQGWGFTGHIVSDCAAISDFFRGGAHGYVKTPEQAVASALNAGTDVICANFSTGGDGADPQVVVRAVKQGLLKEAVLDRALVRLFEARMRLGLFDPAGAGPYGAIASTDFDTPAHRAKAMQVARESLVLLKNGGLLPLKAEPRRIAVIGPNADSLDALVGNYNGTPSQPVTVLAGLHQRFPKARIDFVEGSGLVGVPLTPLPDGVFCRDAACATPGLKVEEFAGTSFGGPAVRASTDTGVRFSWGRPTRAERKSSIRWSGYVRPQETGEYRFHLDSDSGYRIRVDGTVIVDTGDPADPTSIVEREIVLQAGQPHAITVEAIQEGARGDQALRWSAIGQSADAAVAAAKAADLVVFVGGLTAKLEGEEMRVQAAGFAGGDRTSLDLPAPQQHLLESVQATGKPVVLVLMNGSALAINWADRHVPAIVEAWYPGGEGGRAVADLIAGDFSPSGRLPVTFYRSADQLPAFNDYAMQGRTYRYFTGPVLYSFGHGLSFTRFSYGKLAVPLKVGAGPRIELSVPVTNSGAHDGDEVVQLYVSRGLAGAPVRALQGFRRVHLRAGETQVVRFTLDRDAWSVVDAQGRRGVAPGRADVWVGGGQPLAGVAGSAAKVEVLSQ